MFDCTATTVYHWFFPLPPAGGDSAPRRSFTATEEETVAEPFNALHFKATFRSCTASKSKVNMQDRYNNIGFVQQILGLNLVPRKNGTFRGNDTSLSDFSGNANVW